MNKIIEPSLLALDKFKAKEQLNQIKKLKLRYVHYDVMDEEFIGHKALTGEYIDILEKFKILPNVHLMVDKPKKYIKLFKDLKINSIVFHVETQNVTKAKALLKQIHALGFKAGIAIKMETNLKDYIKLAPYCEMVLVMSVNPGLGGQKYSNKCIHNLKVAQEMQRINSEIRIQLDGGVDDKIIKKNLPYVDNFISGSWFFKNIDRMKPIIQCVEKAK